MAEGLRDGAEVLRIAAEGVRDDNEGDRITAESDRADAEELRDGAELIRLQSEIGRNTAEGLRVNAETGRNTAEGLRASAETGRNTAEGTRVTQESARQANTATAISAANGAAEAADTARTELTTAVNTKLGEADDKIEEMDTTLSTYDGRVTQVESDISQLAGDVNLKELKANKQNSLAADGTGTKFPTVDAVNEGLNNLVASFTFNSNPEITINSVDTATDTITSTAHGLVNGDPICITQNNTSTQKGNPLTLFPGGTRQLAYYVINATPDTFQISLTLGGAAINITDNATMSLANIHIEKLSTKTINITQLPNSYEYRVLMNMKVTRQGSSAIQLKTSWMANAQRWLSSLYDTVAWTGTGFPPEVSIGLIDVKLKMNNGKFYIASTGIAAKLTSPTNLGHHLINYSAIDMAYTTPRYINDIIFTSTAPDHFILNGTSLQVYKS